MKLNRHTLFTLSLITLALGIVLLGLAYYFFHFVTDEGLTLTFHEEAGKPFVADLIGQLGVLFIFAAAASLIAAFVLCDKEK